MKQPAVIPDGRFFRLLIPAEPRRYPGQRWIKMIARAAHVVTSGVYLGALIFEVESGTRLPWYLATMSSGLLMACLDLHESGGFVLQLRGLVLVTKLLVLALLPFLDTTSTWIVAGIAFVSVISSHASAKVRYFLIWGRGRIKAPETWG